MSGTYTSIRITTELREHLNYLKAIGNYDSINHLLSDSLNDIRENAELRKTAWEKYLHFGFVTEVTPIRREIE